MRNMNFQKYINYDETMKKHIEIIRNHTKLVLCNNDPNVFLYFEKWIATMLRGKRNKSCLVCIESIGGSGKSSYFDDFLKQKVIGNDLAYCGGSSSLVSEFNGELEDKLMVLYEELECSTKSIWMSVSSKLKRQITAENLMIRKMRENPREVKNYNNYIIQANHESVKDDSTRRYFLLDINTSKIGDQKYFDKKKG